MNTILAILSAVVNSLWQALAVAVLVWLALKFAPRINAATRHAIWWATLGVVMVLPVAPRLIQAMRAHPQSAVVAAVAPKITATPVTAEPFIVTVAPGRTARWPLAIFAVWAAILLWRMFQVGRSYVYLRGVKRRSVVSPVPLPAIGRRVDLLISPDIVSPMAVGFMRPAIVLPESLLAELAEPERDHVLLHESAHLAKYDDWSNLAMRIMGGILALHPVALWILRRIEREREMACDDWVVARTGSARPYAASLARLVELRQARRGEMLASGLFGSGSRIGDRIEMLLRRGRTFSPRASVGGVIASTLVLGALLLAGSLVPRWIAFAQQQPRPAFEVASIKPGDPNDQRVGIHLQPGGRFTTTNATLKILIAFAYDLQTHQISGGPKWLETDNFNIEAKADSTIPISITSEGGTQIRLTLQSLLAERFKLSVHRENKEGPVYELVVAKGGPKLKRVEPNVEIPRLQLGWGRLTGTAVPVSLVARSLSQRLGRTVIDKTGLSDTYDFDLSYTPDPSQAAGFGPSGPDALPPPDPNGPSIFTAVQEQLGLKLESGKGPVEVLVIEHAEKPDAN